MKPDPKARDGADTLQQELLRMVARRRETATEPQRYGASFFFEVRSGWEVRALADDPGVRQAFTPTGLEDAFHDKTVRTILIPCDASISRTIAIRICSRHGEGKTVFFEVEQEDYQP